MAHSNNFSIESRIALGLVIFTEIGILIWIGIGLWIRMEMVIRTNPNPNSNNNNNNNRLSAAALGAAVERRQMLKHIELFKKKSIRS